MKLTKRMKFAILQRGIMNIVLFIAFISLGIFYIAPQVQEVEGDKKEFAEIYDEYEEILKSGITLSQARAGLQRQGLLKDVHTRTIFDIVKEEEDFYEVHFSVENNSSNNYQKFLKEKRVELDEFMQSQEYTDRQDIIDTILPVYTPGITLIQKDDEGNAPQNDISDAVFINNIEQTLRQFQLVHTGQIGVGNLIPVLDGAPIKEGKNNTKNSLSEDLYAIPIDLNINGRKENIIDFIHYLQYVGSIEADYENQTITVYDDDFMNSIFQDEKLFSHSLYRNQVAEIHSLQLEEYPDSKIEFSDNRNIINKIKRNQAGEDYNARLSVYYYVSGYPEYKLRSSIEDMLEDMKTKVEDIDTQIKEDVSSTQENIFEKRALGRRVASIKEELTSIDEALKKDNPKLQDIFMQTRKAYDIYTVIQKQYKELYANQ